MQKDQNYKFNISINDIKQIVFLLNQKPFEENLTLVSFDELSFKDLLNLLTRIIQQVDQKNDINFQKNNEEERAKCVDFLNMLNYPETEIDQLVEKVFQSSKTHIYPILYFILQNFEELKKRAYLGYYLISIQVPDEYLIEEEMKQIFDQYDELREVFKQEHSELEEFKKESPNYEVIKMETQNLEKERDQLKIKLKTFQHEKTEKKEFKDLLLATKQLRKEQEQESKLLEKLNSQQEYMENCEQVLLSWQQRLLDAQNAYGQETSANEMLNALRNELKMHQKNQNDLQFEISEKTKKIQQNELKLSEPVPPQETIKKDEVKLMELKNNVKNLTKSIEEKKDPEKEDKLSIFRRQVAMVVQKKEDLIEEIKQIEQDRLNLELEIEQKKNQIEETKGADIINKEDFQKFQENLNQNLQEEKKIKNNFQQLDQEVGILKRTEFLFKKELKKSLNDIKEYEQKYGLIGLINKENEIEDLTQKKGNLDIMKGKTLEELSTIVEQLQIKIEEKRDKLKPLIDKHKILKAKITELKEDHKIQKQEFEKVVGNSQKEFENLQSQSREKETAYYECEISIELFKEKGTVLDLVYDLLEDEKNYSKGTEALNSEFQTYQDLMSAENQNLQKDVQELSAKRDQVKNTTNNIFAQTEMLNEFQYLLEEKLKSQKRVVQNTTSTFRNSMYNRAVLEQFQIITLNNLSQMIIAKDKMKQDKEINSLFFSEEEENIFFELLEKFDESGLFTLEKKLDKMEMDFEQEIERIIKNDKDLLEKEIEQLFQWKRNFTDYETQTAFLEFSFKTEKIESFLTKPFEEVEKNITQFEDLVKKQENLQILNEYFIELQQMENGQNLSCESLGKQSKKNFQNFVNSFYEFIGIFIIYQKTRTYLAIQKIRQ